MQELNDWFLAGVEPDSERPGHLPPFWFSVAHDIAVFLGELAIARHSNLSWEFFVWGKKNVAYQRPVIMGFAGEDPKYRTNADPEASVLSYAHATIAARGSRREHGTVNVRGVSLDIDSLLGSPRPPQTDEFVRWLAIIDRRNAEHPGAR
ncbi:hypothetical protein [Agromyces soli]|uniref:Uncharacterized protein n=1 Tax=Agromyces soli TaxID=659012 RepID=A0ABY4AZI3_9MICO|nr:hypothetical protein [Agromyces soli]UOE27526.1 hypothetical protein MTP13_07040 [Agromyces soli]